MPWQRAVWDVAYECDDDGKLWYDEVDLTVPRQSGKTTAMVPPATHRCTAWRNSGGLLVPQRVVYTAQTRAAARLKWEDEHVKWLEASPFDPLFDVRLSNGSEGIRWHNGSNWGIEAVNETAGHGGTNDLAFIDEAFAHADATVEEALAPTMLTRESSQIWVFSTAGNAKSPYLWRKVRDGRKMIEFGQDSHTAYFEWSAPEGAPYDDESVWRGCMPALGYTQTIEKVRRELARLRKSPDGVNVFRRSYLNQWVEIPILEDEEFSIINRDRWYGQANTIAGVAKPPVFALDVSPDRAKAAIGAAGMSTLTNGNRHVEIVDARSGTDWIIPRLEELWKKHRPKSPLLIDSIGPASALAAKITAKKIPVELIAGTDLARACAAFYDDIINSALTHRNQESLNSAVAGAIRRNLGDNYAWDRRRSDVDITPLVAVTLAAYGHSTSVGKRSNTNVYD